MSNIKMLNPSDRKTGEVIMKRSQNDRIQSETPGNGFTDARKNDRREELNREIKTEL